MLTVIIASSLVPCVRPGSTEDYGQPLSPHHIFEICCIIFLPTPWLVLCQHKNSKSKQNHPFGLNASSPSCLTALHPGPHSRSLASKMLLMCILLLPPEMLFPRCPCSLHHHQIFAQRSSSVKAPVGSVFEIILPTSNIPSLSHCWIFLYSLHYNPM